MTCDFELMPSGPDAVLSAQVSGGMRWDADTSGPRALMLAVLQDAVRCIESGRWQHRFGRRRLAAEAEAWVRCDRADWPFSFRNVCEALAIDVDAMRRRLLTTIRLSEITRPCDRPCRKEAAVTIGCRQACAHGCSRERRR